MFSKYLSRKSFQLFGLSRYQYSAHHGSPTVPRPGVAESQKVTLIPGVGIGPEVTRSVQDIFEAAHCPITWDVIENFTLSNTTCTQSLTKNECILLGPLPYREGAKYINNEEIYKHLDLFANLTYARTLPGADTRHKDVDIAVIKENTEGENSGVEHEVYPGVVESIKVITRDGSKRIAEYAFEFAYLSGRKKITAVHKANIMKICDGMFLEATREVAAKYPFIQYEEMIIDNCCMQMVKNPWQFDVMVMPNLYGSIVSNAVAGICGGPGFTSGANIGVKHVIFEQGTRHPGIDIAGKGVANPTAYILSSVLLLKHLNLHQFATIIESALDKTLKGGKVKTQDFGGNATTQQFTNEIIKNLEKV
jgi:isocitrate dehydrogenase (NAD+)